MACAGRGALTRTPLLPPTPPPISFGTVFLQPRQKSRMAAYMEAVSMIADIGQQQWSCKNFRLSDRTLRSQDRILEFSQELVKYKRPPIILISAYILACRAGTSSRYSTGETPPIKAGQPGLCSHLGTAWERGNISTRIWTRALQPAQEEVSSWRFPQAQTVSGPPTFSRSADFFSRRGDFNARQDSIVRLYFCKTPIFCKSVYLSVRRQYFPNPPIFLWGANIFQICLFFCEAPTFSKSPYFSIRRQHFPNPPIFPWGANISRSANFLISAKNLWIAWFLLLQIFVYIFSIYLCI
jgi:hypothetical protein